MTANEFVAWPKIARLNRDMVVTEKIDGTNAAIIVQEDGGYFCQSRTRVISLEQDNFGFTAWVEERRDVLLPLLGPGRHFGEFWGSGIQRGYGLPKGEKRFSLFNTSRWNPDNVAPEIGLYPVPYLYEGLFSQHWVQMCIGSLTSQGSFAAPGFMDPEGVVVFHKAANTMFKVTIKGDEAPKGLQK